MPREIIFHYHLLFELRLFSAYIRQINNKQAMQYARSRSLVQVGALGNTQVECPIADVVG